MERSDILKRLEVIQDRHDEITKLLDELVVGNVTQFGPIQSKYITAPMPLGAREVDFRHYLDELLNIPEVRQAIDEDLGTAKEFVFTVLAKRFGLSDFGFLEVTGFCLATFFSLKLNFPFFSSAGEFNFFPSRNLIIPEIAESENFLLLSGEKFPAYTVISSFLLKA